MHRSGRPRTRSLPGRITVVIVFGRVHSLQGLLGAPRRQETVRNPGSDRRLLPSVFVKLVDEGIDIALSVGNTQFDRCRTPLAWIKDTPLRVFT